MSFETYLLIECHLSRLTVSAYLSDINHFINQSNTQVPTKAGIISFLNELSKQEFTKSSIARKMSALRIFNIFEDEKNEYVPDISNLFSHNVSLKLPTVISAAELNKLLSFSFGNHKYAKRNN